MKNLFASFIRDDEGQDIIEYALLAAFISIVSPRLLPFAPRLTHFEPQALDVRITPRPRFGRGLEPLNLDVGVVEQAEAREREKRHDEVRATDVRDLAHYPSVWVWVSKTERDGNPVGELGGPGTDTMAVIGPPHRSPTPPRRRQCRQLRSQRVALTTHCQQPLEQQRILLAELIEFADGGHRTPSAKISSRGKLIASATRSKRVTVNGVATTCPARRMS